MPDSESDRSLIADFFKTIFPAFIGPIFEDDPSEDPRALLPYNFTISPCILFAVFELNFIFGRTTFPIPSSIVCFLDGAKEIFFLVAVLLADASSNV